MLIWMRNSAFAGVFKFFLLGMLVLAVAGLVLMDIGGSYSGNLGANTVAKGGGVKIGTVEFDRILRRALSSQGIPAQEAYRLGLVNNVLNSEIQNRLFTRESHDLGLEISDDLLKNKISILAEPLATDGRSKRDALQQILMTQNISEAEFVGSIRQNMANDLVRRALQPPATLASPLMAQSLYRYANEKRTIDAIIFQNTSVKDITPPTEEQLQRYYDSNKMDYLIPQTRTITMATLKSDMVRKNLKITDETLKSEYDKNIAAFTKPEKRTLEQIVLSTESEAQKALEDMKAGKSPKNALTQDYESAGLNPAIGAAVFSSKKDSVLGPIKTELGFHVIKIKDIKPETVTPFAEAKESLRRELESIALTEELFNTGNAIEDRAAGGEKFETIVQEYGMTTEIIGPFRVNGNDRDGNDKFKSYAQDRAKLVQAAYDYDEGEIAPLVETNDGQFHMIRIDQVIPDTYRDFKSVQAEIKTRWIAEQQKLSNLARARAALESINGGKNIQDVAAADGTSVRKFNNVNRKDAPPAPITPVAAAQAFTTDKGKAFSSEIDGGYMVGVVTDITLPSETAKPDAEELATLQEITGKSLAEDIAQQYVRALTNGKNIKINQAVLEQNYGDGQQQAR